MTHTFLLEIGLEDLPAANILPAEIQLAERMTSFLEAHRLSFSEIKTYSTPRRLAVQVFDLAESQSDEQLTVRGPSQKIAQNNETGEWTKAAEGFAKGQGAKVSDIIIKDDEGQAYTFIEKFIKGLPTVEILPQLADLIKSLEFSKNMKWGTNDFQYIRPLHSLVALLDDQVIPFEVFGIESGHLTEGHRFFGETCNLLHANEYEDTLKASFVIADRTARKHMIAQQIDAICEEKSWKLSDESDSLLEEVTDLVEYPNAYYGSYDEEFLTVPGIILKTSMISHQRYFPVLNRETSELLPYFIWVRNGTDRNIEEIAHGNEKVLTARLADAKFFYEEDQKYEIQDFVRDLEKLEFHGKLGSLADKQRRVYDMSKVLGEIYHLSDFDMKNLLRAAEIYKFDLVTETVNEFPELQGIMGEILALENGEEEIVASAIGQQYQPSSSEDSLPKGIIPLILSLADKLDTVMHFFAIGLKPTGSNDPFALRRQANGIVRIILELDTHVSFRQLVNRLFNEAIHQDDIVLGFEKNQASFFEFFTERFDQLLASQDQIPHDIRQAVTHAALDDFTAMAEMAKILLAEKSEDQLKTTLQSIIRVNNLAEKATDSEIDVLVFQTSSESELHSHYLRTLQVFEETRQTLPRWRALSSMQESIDQFFEDNMVMVEDEKIRYNRLALLQSIAKLSNQLADFSYIIL